MHQLKELVGHTTGCEGAFHTTAPCPLHRAIQIEILLVQGDGESDQLPTKRLQQLEFLSADKFQHGLDHKYELQRFERHMFRGLRVQLKYLSYHRYSLRQMHLHKRANQLLFAFQ